MTFKEYVIDNIHYTDIDVLNITKENLTDIYGIEEFKNIRHLFLGKNKIVDISPLKYLPKIYNLDISENLIDNFDVLIYLDNLDTLWIYDNPIIKNNLTKYNNAIFLDGNKLIELKNIIKIERRKRLIKLLDK